MAQEACPIVAELFSEAGNVVHNSVAAASREQLAWKMLQSAARAVVGTDLDANEIWRNVLSSTTAQYPDMKQELPGMATFVRRLSNLQSMEAGGFAHSMMDYYTAFLRSLDTKPRISRGSMYGRIANLAVGKEDGVPTFRIAMLMAAGGCSAEYTAVGNEQHLILPKDIAKLSSPTMQTHASRRCHDVARS